MLHSNVTSMNLITLASKNTNLVFYFKDKMNRSDFLDASTSSASAPMAAPMDSSPRRNQDEEQPLGDEEDENVEDIPSTNNSKPKKGVYSLILLFRNVYYESMH